MPLFPPTSVLVWQKFTVSYTQLQTAGLTNSVLLTALPSKAVIHAAIMNITTAFAGTLTLSLSIGTSGNNVKYSTAQTALAATMLTGVGITQPVAESTSGATNISLYAIATVNNLSLLSQGSVDCYLLISQLQ